MCFGKLINLTVLLLKQSWRSSSNIFQGMMRLWQWASIWFTGVPWFCSWVRFWTLPSCFNIQNSMLKKCNKSNTNLNLELPEIRNTPSQGLGTSLAQRTLNHAPSGYYQLLRSNYFPEWQVFQIRQKSERREEGDTIRLMPFRMEKK